MNSIVNTHFDLNEPSINQLETAVCRLGAFLDDEVETLRSVLVMAGNVGVREHFEALAQLHVSPDGTDEQLKELLEEACFRLEILQIAALQVWTCPEKVESTN